MKKLLTLLGLVFLTTFAHCAAITLSWSPNQEEDLSGYRIYWGTTSRAYGNHRTVLTPNTQVTLDGLIPGLTYYFAVTAFLSDGLESGYSQEVQHLVPLPPIRALAVFGVDNGPPKVLLWPAKTPPLGLSLAGYEIHIGTSPGVYDRVIRTRDTAVALNHMDLSEGVEYFFVVCYRYSNGVVSPRSGEVSHIYREPGL
ncbi:MAG: fibronectin type III domain-containing protein [Candidatus Peribacteraceae bacterium]|nr:fibronectin type III domain-containing protein [Candidatus Peribacteraceae bacterium]